MCAARVTGTEQDPYNAPVADSPTLRTPQQDPVLASVLHHISVVGIALLLSGFNHVAVHTAVHRKEGFHKFGGNLEIWRQGGENCGLKGI